MKYNIHKSVVVPKTGEKVSLKDSRRALAKREAWVGQKRITLRKKIIAQRKDFDKLERVINIFNETGNLQKSADSASISIRTAREWINGRRLPKRVSIKWSEKELQKRKPLIITPEKATSFSYVLGALMGDVSRTFVQTDMKQGRLNLSVKDLVFAQEFSKKLEQFTGIKTKIRRFRRNLWMVDIGSRNIIQLFNELTLYGKRVPREFINPKSLTKQRLEKSGSLTSFLTTKEQRTEFAKALYDSRGSIKMVGKTKTIIIKPKNNEITQFVSSVLKENGLTPRIRKDGTIAIPTAQNNIFLQTIGFRRNLK
jgi:hypothetical protein